ncbi:hypothetical protein ANRL3_00744 [Anaerolineae bacterium]|nr:hypothetical protein ANRL3_00744 [Anaerolineae bacterium]
MIEFRIAAIAIVSLVILGLIVGLAAGLWLGWIAWPLQISNVDVTDLKPTAQVEFIILTADSYVLDQDAERAKERLAQLKDPNIHTRVAALARQYAAENNPDAPRLAQLAEALGETDAELAAIARTATPTRTITPTPTQTGTPTLVPSLTPTLTATPTITPTRTATRRPAATRTPALPAAEWIPAYPAGWPGGVKYEPVNVASGQKYWRISKAIYCDSNDEHDYCKDLPGGPLGTDTYIMLIGAGGWRESAALNVVSTSGQVLDMSEKSAGDMCNCNYSWQSNGFTVQVQGAPSDKISGMALYSMKARLSNWHVRYFITYQLVTR